MPKSVIIKKAISLIGIAFILPSLVWAQNGFIQGKIVDAKTDEPIGFAQLLLEEIHRGTGSEPSGEFYYLNVRAGTYTLKVFRIGYEAFSRQITVVENDTLKLQIRLSMETIEGGELVVEGKTTSSTEQAAIAVSGTDLRQHLSSTIAETLEGASGISMRSMGPAPARPVIRGMGGDRLLLLEDGGQTGDLSNTSADHAVAIEPLHAERIEVIRGPASLAYGTSTLGGVINVIRNYVPQRFDPDIHVGLSGQVESVNKGFSTGFLVKAPLGKLALHTDGSLRKALDMQTPIGKLQNTDLLTYNGSIGISKVGEQGYGGIAYSYYNSAYGIPGGFVGAHPNGVDIKLYRNHVLMQGEKNPSNSRYFNHIEGKAQFTYLFQQEFEREDLIGVEFGVGNLATNLKAHTVNVGPFSKGMVGVSGQYRDYKVGGFAFTPFTIEKTFGAFAFQELSKDALHIQLGFRYEQRHITPDEEKVTNIGAIRERFFQGLATSVSASWHISQEVQTKLIGTRSFRMPAVEELFSEGPHLAAYSFDVGNPDLDTEKGIGLEWVNNFQKDGFKAQIALFYNRFQDYIFLQDTGEINVRTLLQVYQYTGKDATLKGIEGNFQVPLGDEISVTGGISFVSGTLSESKKPLPLMPPVKGNVSIAYEKQALTIKLGAKGAGKQTRLGEFESPTDSYVVLETGLQYHMTKHKKLHTFDIVAENLTNKTYRDHLSRVKSVMPEAGFNVKLLYKVFL